MVSQALARPEPRVCADSSQKHVVQTKDRTRDAIVAAYNELMSSPTATRPILQFSLQSLLMLTAMACIGLAFYRLGLGSKVVVHYCFLIFAVGPWFAYLASECLPIKAPQLRTAAANMILLGLFIATLKLAEFHLPGPVAIIVAVAAVVLWTPQYMIFFVWKMGD